MAEKDIESLCGGLPPELCEQLVREQQLIKIRLEKRKFGKEVTIIEGIDERDVDIKKLASQLKSKLATGGTVKNGKIELQGDHRGVLRDLLVELGFPPDNIVVLS
ncbi:MAG: stress response translation initiation inhibitor YciH [Fervidicoccaceae archaeon]